MAQRINIHQNNSFVNPNVIYGSKILLKLTDRLKLSCFTHLELLIKGWCRVIECKQICIEHHLVPSCAERIEKKKRMERWIMGDLC